jgi:hypothetical protein
MYRLAAWTAVLCMSFSSHVECVNIIPQTYVNFTILAFTLWVIFDGILVASDLRAAEVEIKNMQANLRFQETQTQTHALVNDDTIKNMKENHQILCEIRMRVISMNQRLKKQLSTSPDGSLHSETSPPFSSSNPDFSVSVPNL